MYWSVHFAKYLVALVADTNQRAKRATAETLTRFHTDEYIDFLSKVTPENARRLTYQGTRFLVGDDNPPFEGVFEFSSISAGGSIGARNTSMTMSLVLTRTLLL